MFQRVFVVPPEMKGITVQALIHRMSGFPHSVCQGLIDAGCVQVGRRTAEDHAETLAAGARVVLLYDPHTHYRPRPRARPGEGYRVIYEDRDMIVADKDAGLLSVPTPDLEAPSLAERLFEALASRGLKKPQLYAVHRLDRQVSGLLVFARSFEALWGLVPQFETHTARRLYLAIAEGEIEASSGTERSRLAAHPSSRRVRVDPDEGKPAVTHWTVLERFDGATLCRVELETGRKNQIRVHFADMGHPLVGDERYSHPSPLLRRVALHAELLEFEHPVQGGRTAFRSPLPADMMRLLHHLRARGTLADPTLRPLSPEAERELARIGLASGATGVAAGETRPAAAAAGGQREAPQRKEPTAVKRPEAPAGRADQREGDQPEAPPGHRHAWPGKGPAAKPPQVRSERDLLRGRWAKGHRPVQGKKGPHHATANTSSANGGKSDRHLMGPGGGNEKRDARARPGRDPSRKAASRTRVRGFRGNRQGREQSEPPEKRTELSNAPAKQAGRSEGLAKQPDGSGPTNRRAPKSAWLRRREQKRYDPSIPEWVKRRMGLKPPRSK